MSIPKMLKTHIRLGDVAQGQDNNFNLIRFLAAVAVLVSHAWPITGGPGTTEPFHDAIGHSLGSLAVYVFFTLSGFFIAGSFQRSKSGTRFIVARAARLFPGLAVSLAFVAFVMGPVASDLSLGAYLRHPDTAMFTLRNLSLINLQYSLPGVFDALPYPRVEGSIWTLIYEVLCYSMVFAFGVTGLLARRRAMLGALVIYALVWSAPSLAGFDLHPSVAHLRKLSLPFVIGVAFWIWRDRVVLSGPICAGLIVGAIVAHETAFAYPMLVLALSYGAFWLGHAPRGAVRRFNRLGDYSYGIYIYAFPLQGLAIWLWGPMGPALNIALALPMTLICAVASWHWIERPALDLARAGWGRRHRISRQW